jgi:aspartate/methionine/tyrosine aminotransferase
MRLIPRTLDQIPSPIGSVDALLRHYTGTRPILDCSQGAPSYPAPPEITARIAAAAAAPEGAKYTTRRGFSRLRELLAEELSIAYGGSVQPEETLITSGCNQAFCATLSALADFGDAAILGVPYYFNHDMWLRLERITPVYLDSGEDFLPDPGAAAELITARTRAIVLVTPGNPTGVTLPSRLIEEFADLATEHGIALVLDETYRGFRQSDDPPHSLFSRPDWGDTVISLHSFSKEFAIPGHRVGAIVAQEEFVNEASKLFDCMAICAPRLGQEAVIEGFTSCQAWRRAKAAEMRDKHRRFDDAFRHHPGGFRLCASGAFFGWVQHPAKGLAVDDVVLRLLQDYGIMALPGTIFEPSDRNHLRFSFANLSIDEIDELGDRLCEWRP